MPETEQQPSVFSVSEVNAMVRDLLEGSFHPLWIAGEVGNLTIHRSGHVYLTLKDEASQIRAVWFGGAAQCASLGVREGVRVEAFGRLSVYAARGEYQLNIRSLRPFGIGELQRRFDELKQKLAAAGWFDPASKKSIPFLPRRIGVVSSPSGAALKDFLRIALQRFPDLEIRVCPAPVQGRDAAKKLAGAVRFFNRYGQVDVIVLTRGGGSLEDLWPFNEEELAQAIHESRIPVVSAVGHEIDFTISDFTADLRAPTPSGAAEMLVPVKSDLENSLAACRRRMETALALRWERANSRLESAKKARVFVDLNYRLDELSQTVDTRMQSALRCLSLASERAENRLEHALRAAEAYSPYRVLDRGYAILSSGDGRVIRSSSAVSEGERLSARVADGTIAVEVRSSVPGK